MKVTKQVLSINLVNEKRQSMLNMMDALNKKLGGEKNKTEKVSQPITTEVGKSIYVYN